MLSRILFLLANLNKVGKWIDAIEALAFLTEANASYHIEVKVSLETFDKIGSFQWQEKISPLFFDGDISYFSFGEK